MGKTNGQRKKARGNNKQKNKSRHSHQKDEERGSRHLVSLKILKMVTSQWPTLIASESIKPIALEFEISESSYEGMWDQFDQLDGVDKLAWSTIHDPGKVSFIDCVTLESIQKQMSTVHDGLFLALKAPGRDDLNYTSLFMSWGELLLTSSEFQEPSENDKLSSREILKAIGAFDVGVVGRRSAYGFFPETVDNARKLIENGLGTLPKSGRVGSAKIRAGDDDDFQSMKDPNRVGTSKTHEKMASCLYSGSIPSLLSLMFLQTIQINYLAFLRQKQQPNQVELCAHQYDYLLDSIDLFREETGVKEKELLQDTSIQELFSCPFLEIGTEKDEIKQACAAKLVEFHAQRIAQEMISQQREASRKQELQQEQKMKIKTNKKEVKNIMEDILKTLEETEDISVTNDDGEDDDDDNDQESLNQEGYETIDDNESGNISPNSNGTTRTCFPPPLAPTLSNRKKGEEVSCLDDDDDDAGADGDDEDGWKKVPGKSRKMSHKSRQRSPSPATSVTSSVSQQQQQQQHRGRQQQQHRRHNRRSSGLESVILAASGHPHQQYPNNGGFIIPRRSRGESMDTMSISSAHSGSTAPYFPDEVHHPPISVPPVQPVSQQPAGASSAAPVATNAPAPAASTSSPSWGTPIMLQNPNLAGYYYYYQQQQPAIVHDTQFIHPSIIASLDHDLEEMAQMLQRIAERRRPWQLAVAERIKATVEQVFPGATAQVFGSLATGLAAPCSDVDMVVRNFNEPSHIAMKMLADALRQQTWVTALQELKHATVPVIKLTTAQIPISFGNQGSLITVDITFDNYSHRGLRTCILVQGLLQRYPVLKPLVLVLKQFLVEKGLNDPFVGGLSSYGLVVMISAILQRHFPSGMPNSDILPRSLGILFVAFLCEYSTSTFVERGVWLYTNNVAMPEQLSIAKVQMENALESIKAKTKAPLYVLDPLDVTNNIGRTCFGIHQVIQAFAEALEAIQLTAVRQDIDTLTKDWSVLGSVFSTGHHRHVVHLVTQVWCPRENPVPEKPRMNMEEWAITAKSLLEIVEQKSRVCVWCHQKPHTPSCTLKSLLKTFPKI